MDLDGKYCSCFVQFHFHSSWHYTVKIVLFSQFFYFIGSECDERVSNSVSLKSKLATSYEPEVIKDILFDLHEISEQSHAKVYFDFFKFHFSSFQWCIVSYSIFQG